MSEEGKRAVSERQKGRKISEEHKKNLRKPKSEKAKANMKGHSGVYVRTPKMIEKHRKAMIGKKYPKELYPNAGMRGKHLSEETKRKISLANRGEKNYFWKGGITSFEPYSIDWTETLRRSIRERDRYTCQLCGKEPAVSVHHIDYNKKNCNPTNLITLCKNCSSKVNFKRTYWKKYFIKRMSIALKKNKESSR